MKIAVTSTGPTLDDNVEVSFGRCAFFLIIDIDTMQHEAIENPNIALGGGAGIQSAQLMSEKDVTMVLTGNCDPNAFNVFDQAGIQVIIGVSGPVRNAVEKFKTGSLSSASGPNVASHFGMNATPTNSTTTSQQGINLMDQGIGGIGFGMSGGRGMDHGSGMGHGKGRGQGKGGGGGMDQGMPSVGSETNFLENTVIKNPDQELAELKQQAYLLGQQKKQLNQRIAPLESNRKAVAVIDSEKCAGCGICLDVCPTGAIEVNQQAEVNEEACIGCSACVSECPNEAIVIAQIKFGK